MKTIQQNKVLKIHGIFILIVTAINTITSLIGLKTGQGVFAFIQHIPMAEVGLFQAYLLMLLIGIVLLLNVKSEHSWRYDIVGVLAHLIPLSALLMFQDVVKQEMGLKIFFASALIHIPWIVIETIAAFTQYRKSYENAI